MMQVFDLSLVNPPEFVHFSLGVLEQLAELGDGCAKGVREKLRVVVCLFGNFISYYLSCSLYWLSGKGAFSSSVWKFVH